jgi:hypothetical protein
MSAPVTGDVQFTPTVPASRPFAKRKARSIFLVYTDAYNPNLSGVSRLGHLRSELSAYSVLFAFASTSSSDLKTLMLTTGPKISSFMILASSGVFLKMVGWM